MRRISEEGWVGLTAADVIKMALLPVIQVKKTQIEVTVYRSPDSITAFMAVCSRLGCGVTYNGVNIFFPLLLLSTRQIHSTIMARQTPLASHIEHGTASKRTCCVDI